MKPGGLTRIGKSPQNVPLIFVKDKQYKLVHRWVSPLTKREVKVVRSQFGTHRR